MIISNCTESQGEETEQEHFFKDKDSSTALRNVKSRRKLKKIDYLSYYWRCNDYLQEMLIDNNKWTVLRKSYPC